MTIEGFLGTLEFYLPVLIAGVSLIAIIYILKKRNERK